jgi:hypothetical protein
MDAKKTATTNRFYLFRNGRLVGPVSGEKVEYLRKSKEIFQYSWIMDEDHQSWIPIDAMPTENPFQATLTTLKERTLSGAFLNRAHPITGVIKGMHSFGIELLVEGQKSQAIAEHSNHLLNLIDETNMKSTNAEVIYQGQEKTPDGILIRFHWRDAPTPL